MNTHDPARMPSTSQLDPPAERPRGDCDRRTGDPPPDGQVQLVLFCPRCGWPASEPAERCRRCGARRCVSCGE